MRKVLFFSTVMAAKDVRQFRAICVRTELLTSAEAEAVRDKAVLFEKLVQSCWFSEGAGPMPRAGTSPPGVPSSLECRGPASQGPRGVLFTRRR